MGLVSRPPRGALRLVLRAPILLYRCGLGWLLGSRFLMLAHIGRQSGERRRTVLDIVRRVPDGGRLVICSGWGGKAQWFRNIQVNPEVEVHAGRGRGPCALLCCPR